MRLKHSYIYKIFAFKIHKLIVNISPRLEMIRVYKSAFKKKPNLNNPKDLIEKIFWLQLNSDTSLWTKCADKYRMREYVRECGLENYLPKLLGHWTSVEDLSFKDFPQNFILKTNNGCGTCLVVKDSKYNLNLIKEQFKQWLSIPFGYSGAQLHYTRISPCIIAEELLEQTIQEKKISPNSLIDYKIWCFKGKPEAIFIVYNRNHEGIYMALYDLNWNAIPEHLVSGSYYKYDPNVFIPKPSCLSEMLDIARRLSLPFQEVRCDFYVINDKPYIGELTFTSGFPYFTNSYYNYLGSMIEL